MRALIGCVLTVGCAAAAADVEPASTPPRSAAVNAATRAAHVASGQGGSASAVRNATALRNTAKLLATPRTIPPPMGRQGATTHATPMHQAGAAPTGRTVHRPVAAIPVPGAMARTAVVGGPRTQQRGSLGGPVGSSATHGGLNGTAMRRRF